MKKILLTLVALTSISASLQAASQISVAPATTHFLEVGQNQGADAQKAYFKSLPGSDLKQVVTEMDGVHKLIAAGIPPSVFDLTNVVDFRSSDQQGQDMMAADFGLDILDAKAYRN